MNKEAIKISLRGLAPKGYTSNLLQRPLIGLHPAAALKLHFRDCSTTELWPSEKLVNMRYILFHPQQELKQGLCCLDLSPQSRPRKMSLGLILNALLAISRERKEPC